MAMKLVMLLIMVRLVYGELNAVDEGLKSERFVYEEQLLKKVIRMEFKMEQMEREMLQTHDKMTSTLQNLTLEIENKTTELKLVEERVSLPMVAFNAYSLTDYSLDTNQILIFRNTYLNEGNGYDNVLGLFTAPVAGLYMFSMHACNYGGRGFYYYIVVDNSIIAQSTKYNNVQTDCASVVTLTKLKKDQRVWVKCASGSSSSQLSDTSYRQSTFSGVLLRG
ncbi:hypothetical protein ACF0H5_000513 [Mactra antiquata]